MKTFNKTYVVIGIITIILVLISYINFIDSKKSIISLVQDQDEKTLYAVIAQLEDRFQDRQNDLKTLSDIISMHYSNDLSEIKAVIDENFKNGDYYAIGYVNKDGTYIYRAPGRESFSGRNIKDVYDGSLQWFLKKAEDTKQSQVTDVFRLDKSNLGISIVSPIIKNNEIVSYLVGTFSTEDIAKPVIYSQFLNSDNTIFGIDKYGVRVFSINKKFIGTSVYDEAVKVKSVTGLTMSNYKKMSIGIRFKGMHDAIFTADNPDKVLNRPEKKYIVSDPVNLGGNFKFSLAVTSSPNRTAFLSKFVMKELGLFLAVILIIVYLSFRIMKNQIERKEIEKSLAETEASEKLKTEFFCNMSHELRTPLTIILNALHFILKRHENEIEKDSEVKKMFLKIRQNAMRLLKLVNNLLEISRIDAGMISREPENLDIIKIVEDITMSVVFYAQQKGIELIFDTEVEEKVIAIDEDGIERVVMNLLSNAIKFTPAGGKILVNIYEDKEYVNVSVKDSGIGIPEDKLQFIFERFMQVNDSALIRTAEGTGVGLAIVKSIVEMHKGEIKVSSKKGEETEFIIRLPNRVIEDKQVGTTKKLDQEIVNNINIEFSDIQ